MTANRLPGGLFDASTEFFTVISESGAYPLCIHAGRTYEVEQLPESTKAIIANDMYAHPTAYAAMEVMVGCNEAAKLKQYIMCRYGALNTEPDISAEGVLSEPEYVPCLKRGLCVFEGKVCASIMVQDGVFLSRAETEVFKRVQLADKVIADQLFLSVETVKKHFQNIRNKTGLANKIEMAIWATQKGII